MSSSRARDKKEEGGTCTRVCVCTLQTHFPFLPTRCQELQALSSKILLAVARALIVFFINDNPRTGAAPSLPSVTALLTPRSCWLSSAAPMLPPCANSEPVHLARPCAPTLGRVKTHLRHDTGVNYFHGAGGAHTASPDVGCWHWVAFLPFLAGKLCIPAGSMFDTSNGAQKAVHRK